MGDKVGERVWCDVRYFPSQITHIPHCSRMHYEHVLHLIQFLDILIPDMLK